MKKILEKISAVFEKVPLVTYILIAFLQSFLISVVVVAVVYGILWATGIYANLETALDLKYNSLVMLVPMWGFAALFLICLMVGTLLYFYKYKRRKPQTAFYKALAPAFGKK